MIQFNKQPGQRILELGGGNNRHLQADVMTDVRPGPQVDFVCDFDKPLPIQSDEWDAVYSHFALEHISFHNLPVLLREILRILKPGGTILVVVPDVEAQIKWIAKNPNGWDGKDLFTSASELLYGSQDYPENSHKAYLTPNVMMDLFLKTGFSNINIKPYGGRNTDMVIQGVKPEVNKPNVLGTNVERTPVPHAVVETTTPMGKTVALLYSGVLEGLVEGDKAVKITMPREELFDKHYFNGGGKVGGYAREGYRDFPCHEITFRHVLARKPTSVLELGAGRGYILKRLKNAGVGGVGLEISKHCCMTRVCDGIIQADLCDSVWSIDTHPIQPSYDLCYSVATLEHIPEEFIPNVIRQMKIHSRRGLHGVDFGTRDDGFDRTHVSLFPKEKWEKLFAEYAPGWPVEIVDKEELERGEFPGEILAGDGKVKLNVGSFTNMFHHGWVNIDTHDLVAWAGSQGYKYQRLDVRNGLPYPTGGVHLIFAHHFLEHLSYDEGLAFLKECRRVLAADGALRLVVPDAQFLIGRYPDCPVEYDERNVPIAWKNTLHQFDEINDGCEKAPTPLRKLWELLLSGHQSVYDGVTLLHSLEQAGFQADTSRFGLSAFDRNPRIGQILAETTEMSFGGLSLFCDAFPLLSTGD